MYSNAAPFATRGIFLTKYVGTTAGTAQIYNNDFPVYRYADVLLLLAEAKARGMNLSNSQIRQILMDSARKNPPSGGWHEQYGYGRVSAHAAVEAVIKLTT
ncbi:MAG: RagB/SusD family nutrient uptake outer membrane protein, partial [Blastocatellia bacterium]|nr:RagB/SusD family nutrient uptake outer membrane protein [Blastocatellia bacterium]